MQSSLLAHAAAVAWTLTGFCFLAVSFFGWGRLASRILAATPGRTDVAMTVLLGWAFHLLVLQILHFVVAIRGWVAIPMFAAGILMSVPWLRTQTQEIRRKSSSAGSIGIIVGFALVAIWIASRGMPPVENFDSGLYHLSMIRWINTYAIVPGLGNLHDRLAFNQSFFTYAAALNAGWFSGHARSVANGFLFLAVLFQVVEGLCRRGLSTITSAAHLLVVPVFVYLALSSEGFTSPTPDLAAALLQLSIFLIFVRVVGEWRSKREAPAFALTVLPVLAATAITIGLSTIAFSASVIAACILIEIHPSYRDPRNIRRAALRLAPAALVVLVWLIRGIVLSGCPLYPALTGCLPVEWAVPAGKVMNLGNWVYSWAREPGMDPRIVLGSWRWLVPWMTREMRDVIGFVFPLVASVILLVAAAVLRLRGSAKRVSSEADRRGFIILIPIVLGIAFWFFTAPDPRFGRALFWMLSISAAAMLFDSLEPQLSARSRRNVAGVLFLGVNVAFLVYVVVKGPSRITHVSTSGWRILPTPSLIARQTSSGLRVYVPARGERCWDAPLPCTPYFNPDLVLRVSGRLSRGFIDETQSGGSLLPLPPRQETH